MNLNEFESCKLKRKYSRKLERYIYFAQETVFITKKEIQYVLYKVRDSKITIITKNLDIEDSKKAFVNNGIMYVSDWAMEQNKEKLMHIIIHELTHIFYPDYTEDEVIKHTDIEFKKLKRNYKWIIFT